MGNLHLNSYLSRSASEVFKGCPYLHRFIGSLRDLKDTDSSWRDYKAVRLQGIYYAAFYQDNDSLVDYVNAQRLLSPLVCLGDGHDGVWNLFSDIATSESREEIQGLAITSRRISCIVGGSLKRKRRS